MINNDLFINEAEKTNKVITEPENNIQNGIGSGNDHVVLIPGDEALEHVKRKINNALTASPRIIRKFTSHLASTSGKFIRAMSLLTCAEDKEGMVHPDAIKFAAAIELLHLASLVHDDIIDDAATRRGIITLHKKYGNKTAVICGDYLVCLALKIGSNIPDKEKYLKINAPDYMTRICLGELNEHLHNGCLDLSVYQYLKIISGKTAALFQASFHAGAVLSEKDERIIRKYARLGKYIGMIFQMTDDCMDFEATEDIARKPVQSDFEQGVITLPLIYALSRSEDLKEKAKSGNVTRQEINEAVARTGGIGYTRLVSKRYYEKSMKIINELDISESKREKLVFVLDKASRNFNRK